MIIEDRGILGDGSGQPHTKALTGDSRISAGQVGLLSINLMRHKSGGPHQRVSMPNLLPARRAPAVAPEPEVTQSANGADESWHSAAVVTQE